MTQAEDTAKTLAERFYDALFGARFAELNALYDPDVHFTDALFEHRGRERTMKMWRTLFRRPTGRFHYAVRSVEAQPNGDLVVHGHWDARYRLIGRVVNEIDSELTLRNGKVTKHVDRFPLDRWLGMALALDGSRWEGLKRSPLFQAAMKRGLRAFVRVGPAAPMAPRTKG